jgi:histidine ammonia-lyase
MRTDTALEIRGNFLSLAEILSVSRFGQRVALSESPEFLARLELSRNVVDEAIAAGKVVYGVNTNFGGLANQVLNDNKGGDLQDTLIWGLKCSIGQPLPIEVVRAAMLIRANTLARGASGIRA